jgi:hypothetical protein
MPADSHISGTGSYEIQRDDASTKKNFLEQFILS